MKNRSDKTFKRKYEEEKQTDENLVIGRNAVRELLKGSRSIDKILCKG